MGFFSFLSKGFLYVGVEQIEKKIKNTDSYKYFSKNDTEKVRSYRQFEASMVASALTFLAFDMDEKNSSNKEDIQTIYIGKNADFIRSVKKGNIKTDTLNVDINKANKLFKGDIEAQLCWDMHVIFSNYLKELKMSLDLNSAQYFEKYNEPTINDFTGEVEEGTTWYFNFIMNILLPEEQIGFDDRVGDFPMIGGRSILILNRTEEEMLDKFVWDLNVIKKDGK
jgi:hypothetical protein